MFMLQSEKYKNLGMRFDAVILQQSGDDTTVNWIPNAFYADAY